MSRRQNSCIFGCDTLGVPLHGFPNRKKRPEVLEEWLAIIPKKMTADDRRLKYLKVCDYHFKLEHRTRGHHITVNAIPSLFLTGVPKVATEFDKEHNYCLPRPFLSTVLNVPPAAVQLETGISSTNHECVQPVKLSTSPEPDNMQEVYISTDIPCYIPDVDVSLVIPNSKVYVSTDIPCDPLEVCVSSEIPCDPLESCVSTDVHWDMLEVYDSMDIPYDLPEVCVSSIPNDDEAQPSTQTLGQVPTRHPKGIKDYQREIISLKKKIKRMQKTEQSLKTKLERSTKIAKSAVKLSNNMSEEARIFIQLQCRESGKKSKGRRFSEKEKILALSLMRKNPRGYSVLCKYFCLPSFRTLRPKRRSQIKRQRLSESAELSGEKSSVIYDAFVTA